MMNITYSNAYLKLTKILFSLPDDQRAEQNKLDDAHRKEIDDLRVAQEAERAKERAKLDTEAATARAAEEVAAREAEAKRAEEQAAIDKKDNI
jgi:hypothetical protein